MKHQSRVLNVLAVVALAAALGGLTTVDAPHANAVGTWAAIAWSPPEGVSGTGDGFTQDEATGKAMSGCTGNGGTACVTVISAENACIAVAAFVLTYGGGKGPTLDAARSAALTELPSGTIKQAMCGGNPGAPPAQKAPPPVAPPGQGIDVSWSPSPIGLNVTVANKTQNPGKCTYNASPVNLPLPAYHREFDLPAFQKVSWLIPAIATGTTWRTVVRCGDPNNPGQQIGYFEQTSSF